MRIIFYLISTGFLILNVLSARAGELSRFETLKEIQKTELIFVRLECDSSFYPKIKKKTGSPDPDALAEWNAYAAKVDRANLLLDKYFLTEWKFNQSVSIRTKSEVLSIPKAEWNKYSIMTINKVVPDAQYEFDEPYYIISRLGENSFDYEHPEKCDYAFPLMHRVDQGDLYNAMELILSLRIIQYEFEFGFQQKMLPVNYLDYCIKTAEMDRKKMCGKYFYISDDDYDKDLISIDRDSTAFGKLVFVQGLDSIQTKVLEHSEDSAAVVFRYYCDNRTRAKFLDYPLSPNLNNRTDYIMRPKYTPDNTAHYVYLAVEISTGKICTLRSTSQKQIIKSFISRILYCED